MSLTTATPAPAVVPTDVGYRLDLGFFEGPLDLLLFLIQRDEINIHEIPIAHITEQYLHYLDLMRRLDLELAGEYLVMATTLMTLKAYSLLPKERRAPEAEAIEGELVDRILEYRLYKELGNMLHRRELMASYYHRHGDTSPAVELMPTQEVILEVTQIDLTRAYTRVVERLRAEQRSHILPEDVRIEDRIRQVRDLLSKRERIPFEALIADDPRRIIASVTFFAVLELARSQTLRIFQAFAGGPLFVARKPPEEANQGLPWGSAE